MKFFILQRVKHTASFRSFLGLDSTEIAEYFTKHKLRGIPYTHITKIRNYMLELGFSDEDLRPHGGIFRMSNTLLDQRVTLLKEGGVSNIYIEDLQRFRTFLTKTIDQLKSELVILPETNVSDSFLYFLNPKPPDFSLEGIHDGMRFGEIHKHILQRYLAFRLETSESEITTLFRTYTSVNYKPLQYVCSNINFAKSIGYTNSKILRNGYILHAHPWNINDVITNIPTFAGCDIKREMLTCPKLMGVPLDNFISIHNVLKNYGISDEAISKYMAVFTLNPNTVEKRLREVESDPELKILIPRDTIMRVVLSYNRAMRNLKTLKEMNLKCTNATNLAMSQFDDYIKDGRDSNSDADVFNLVYHLLKGKGNVEIERRLKMHPYYKCVPLVNIEDSYWCLRELKFSNRNIAEVVQLLLYPRAKILNGHEKVKSYMEDKNVKPTRLKVHFLNLILYFIEKDHHFKGNGIWIEENLLL